MITSQPATEGGVTSIISHPSVGHRNRNDCANSPRIATVFALIIGPPHLTQRRYRMDSSALAVAITSRRPLGGSVGTRGFFITMNAGMVPC